MNKTLATFVAFTTGGIIGVITTRQYFKTIYEKRADEEIESVLSSSIFSKDTIKEENELSSMSEELYMKEYGEILEKTNYSGFAKDSDTREVHESMRDPEKPYLISFDEFGAFEDWNEVQITYYADDILVDQDDEVITDAEDQFGYECLKQFDNPDCGDAIYVRNELLETDYEIVRDTQPYEE